jgi:hypothetical protein
VNVAAMMKLKFAAHKMMITMAAQYNQNVSHGELTCKTKSVLDFVYIVAQRILLNANNPMIQPMVVQLQLTVRKNK